jgi:hypothetical protein
MKKIISKLRFFLRPSAFSVRPLALANELGGLFDDGRETLQIDPSATLPVSGKYLVYERGSSQYYAKPTAGVNLPLGISPDAPYQLGDFLNVERFGATKGTQLGFSAGAITIDHLVGSAAAGLIQDVTSAANGSYWVIGRATKTVSGANQEISFLPGAPYQVTLTGGVMAYAVPG